MSNYRIISCDYITKLNNQIIPCEEVNHLKQNRNNRFYCDLHQTLLDGINALQKEKIITEYQNQVIKVINNKRCLLINQLEQLAKQFDVIPSLKLLTKDFKSLEYFKAKYQLNAINEIWNEINQE